MLQHLPLSSLQTYTHMLQSVWNLKASQRFLVQFHFTGINRGLTLDCSYCCPQGGVFCLCRSVMTAQHCYLNRYVGNKMIIITQIVNLLLPLSFKWLQGCNFKCFNNSSFPLFNSYYKFLNSMSKGTQQAVTPTSPTPPLILSINTTTSDHRRKGISSFWCVPSAHLA